MKILKWKTSDDFYLLENLVLGGIKTRRLTFIKKKEDKATESIVMKKHFSGRLYSESYLKQHDYLKDNFKQYNLNQEDLCSFLKKHNLNPYILKTWTSKNDDGSLTYNPRRFFTYFDEALISKRTLFNGVEPYFLIRKEDDENKIAFISLQDDGESIWKNFTAAHSISLWHMFQENNLEYRVYLSKKDLQKTIQKALKIK